MKIVLLGARGSGKSTVGRRLAQRLGCRFVDLDDVVLAGFEQATITDLWRVHGEPVFRRAEARHLDEQLAGRGLAVIALGGGTPTVEDARAVLDAARSEGRAVTFYLECSADVLETRLRLAPGDRPSLTGDAVGDEIAQILAERQSTYRATADHRVSGEEDAETVAWEIERLATERFKSR